MVDKYGSGSGGGRKPSSADDHTLTALDRELRALYQAYGECEEMPPEIRRLARELEAKLADRGGEDAD